MARTSSRFGATASRPAIRNATSADGTTIAWTATGTGPPLALLPGVPFSNFEAEWRIPIMRRAFEEMGRSVRLIQYDGRGNGASQRSVADLSLGAMVQDLEAVLDEAGGEAGDEPVTLLGFYHSCTHAIAYAARHPERVKGLILFGGSTRGRDPMASDGTQALLSLIERDWDTFVASVAHAWLGWPDSESGRLAVEWLRTSTTPDVAIATLVAAGDIDVTDEASHVVCPALVLHRRDATVIPRAVSDDLAGALPEGRLLVLDGRSASLFLERPASVVRTVVEFTLGRRVTTDGRTVDPASVKERRLTPRELEILGHVAQGETNAAIASTLGISEHTVERHLANVYVKIDARGRADAVAFVVRRGLA